MTWLPGAFDARVMPPGRSKTRQRSNNCGLVDDGARRLHEPLSMGGYAVRSATFSHYLPSDQLSRHLCAQAQPVVRLNGPTSYPPTTGQHPARGGGIHDRVTKRVCRVSAACSASSDFKADLLTRTRLVQAKFTMNGRSSTSTSPKCRRRSCAPPACQG